MRLLTIPADANPSFSKLNLSLATTTEEVREVQRLRYKVFIESMGLSALSNPDGLDKDDFDAYCDHLIVRDTKTLKVVGTYRILGPNAAREMGRYYSETEFDLSRLHSSGLPQWFCDHVVVGRFGSVHAPRALFSPDWLRKYQSD